MLKEKIEENKLIKQKVLFLFIYFILKFYILGVQKNLNPWSLKLGSNKLKFYELNYLN